MSERITISSTLRKYDAEFIDDFASILERELGSGGFLVMDSIVLDIYKERLEKMLSGREYVVIEASEHNKTIDKSKELIELLVENGVRKNQKLVAVGGGVVQDITAFTASIIYRGIDWVFFPTTLLAQADSCIGSKTSINLGNKKNLIGNFYPPSRIYIDLNFIDSLSLDDVKSGIGEMMHFYLYSDSPYFKKLVDNYEKVLSDRKLFSGYIKESLSIKKSVIESDEFDRGERNKFNYGHTFGHAIETVTDYAVKHGQAVTVGMDIANFISFKIGLMEEKVFKELNQGLVVNFPDCDFDDLDIDVYLKALLKDKKNIGSTIGCILAEKPGKLVKKQILADEDLIKMLVEYFSAFYFKK